MPLDETPAINQTLALMCERWRASAAITGETYRAHALIDWLVIGLPTMACL